MSLFAKENLRTIGEGINTTGYVISGIGLIAPLIAITAANNKKSNSRKNSADWRQNNITIVNLPGNQSLSPSLPNISLPTISFPNKNSSQDEINVYSNYCKFGNIVGILLAVALEVPWVALMLGGLWLTGAGALMLGKSIIAYAESQPASLYNEPGSGAEHLPLAISMSPASAPPMDPYEPGNDAERPPSVPPSEHSLNQVWPAHPQAYFALPPSAPPLELSERDHDGFYPGLP